MNTDAMTTDTLALVLETNNLRGGDDPALVTASLVRLLQRLRAQTSSLDRLDEVVVTHDGLDAAARAELEHAAGRALAFVELPDAAGYYEAKNRGFDATRAAIAVFGDADCWPDPGWLDALLAPFADRTVGVVAGRTTYRDDRLGAAATAIDFMYFPTPLGAACTRNFYANNVAFRREVFARFRYRAAATVYRGHCQQLGLRLHAAGVPVRFAPRARTVHRMPDSVREFVRLRLLRGADTIALAPLLASSVLPPALAPLGQLPGLAPAGVLAARLGFSLRAVNHQDLAPVHGLARVACLASVAGISALDAIGAAVRGAGLSDLGVIDGALARDRLSYHADIDGLRVRSA